MNGPDRPKPPRIYQLFIRLEDREYRVLEQMVRQHPERWRSAADLATEILLREIDRIRTEGT